MQAIIFIHRSINQKLVKNSHPVGKLKSLKNFHLCLNEAKSNFEYSHYHKFLRLKLTGKLSKQICTEHKLSLCCTLYCKQQKWLLYNFLIDNHYIKNAWLQLQFPHKIVFIRFKLNGLQIILSVVKFHEIKIPCKFSFYSHELFQIFEMAYWYMLQEVYICYIYEVMPKCCYSIQSKILHL